MEWIVLHLTFVRQTHVKTLVYVFKIVMKTINVFVLMASKELTVRLH